MRLITNSVAPTKVEEKADHYIIKSVPFVRAQRLSGGYVPEWSIKQTANEWQGVAATLNHPRDNNGKPVPAESKPETHIGRIEDSWFDGEYVRANIKLDKADLQSADAKAVKDALESGEQIHVSSQYVPRELPPGEYDGEVRENVEAIQRPDSVAILPNKRGKCDIQDGCGINPQMVANAEVTIPMQANQIEYDISDVFDAEEYSENDYVDDEWNSSEVVNALPNPSESDEAPGILDDTHALVPQADEARDNKSNWKAPFRANPEGPVNTRALVAIKAAASGARGGFEDVEPSLLNELESRADEMLAEAPADLFGAQGDMSENAIQKAVDWVANLMDSAETGPAESGVENDDGTDGGKSPSANGSEDNMNREKLINEITANSPLTEESLKERCNDGLEAIHSDVMEANGTDNTMSDNNDGAITFESEEEFEQYVDEIVANRVEEREKQSQKETLAREIVANSADYEDTESVLEDYPTEAALEAKRDALDTGAAMPGKGVSANFDGASEDDEFDVSSGVLTE